MTVQSHSMRPILYATALAWLFALGGPALAKTDYVGNLNGLTAIEDPGFDAVYAKAGTLPQGFNSVYVAPVGVIVGQDPTLDKLSVSERQQMQDYLYKHLTKELGAKFTLADKPGAGVLVVNALLTALRANKPTMSDLQRSPSVDYARSFGVGQAGVQIDVLDGGSHELLAAFVDHEVGDSLDSNINRYIQWGDAQEFIRGWARDLADTLDG